MPKNEVNLIDNLINNMKVKMDNKEANITNNFNMNVSNGTKEKPIENLLYWRNTSSCFKGRSQTLTNIHELLQTHKIVVIYGAPGIGKTETVRKYGNMYADNYDRNLFWINSETTKNIQKYFHKLATLLKLDIKDDELLIYAHFKDTQCLIVFDNAEDMESIKDFLPSSDLYPTIKILITSQLSDWDNSFGQICLEELEKTDAVDIFRHKLEGKFKEYPLKTWEDLVCNLGRIPLALQVVSSLVRVEFRRNKIVKFDLTKYINDLDYIYPDSDILKKELNYYDNTVSSSIHSAINRLKIGPLQLLCFIAYLDADYIYTEDILFIHSEEQLQDALTVLSDYSLIRFRENDSKIEVHRTIQLVLRKYDLKDQNGQTFETVLKTILTDGNNKLLFEHRSSLFKYVNSKDFEEKSEQFYHNNTELKDVYVCFLARYNCDCILELILPTIKDNKLLNKILFEAICNKNTVRKTIDLLIKQGAKIEINLGGNKTNAFLEATTWLSIELFDRLLKLNPEMNVINSTNSFGQTILHLLVENIDKNNIQATIECVDSLISKHEANIFAKTNDGYTILHTACWNKNINYETIKYFLENYKCKDFVNTKNKKNGIPIQLLLKWKLTNSILLDIIKYFINDCNLDITIQDDDRWNTLFFVCSLGTPEVIRFVMNTVDCRHIINKQNVTENVAFTQLIFNTRIEEHDKIDLMKLFIDINMDFTVINKKKETLAEIAEEWKLMKLSQELKSITCSGTKSQAIGTENSNGGYSSQVVRRHSDDSEGDSEGNSECSFKSNSESDSEDDSDGNSWNRRVDSATYIFIFAIFLFICCYFKDYLYLCLCNFGYF